MSQKGERAILEPIGANIFVVQSQFAAALIDKLGHIFGNTRELLNLNFEFAIQDLDTLLNVDLDRAEKYLRYAYYHSAVYDKRLESERFHYEQIKYSLLHNVERLHFFNQAPLETRKNIIFSDDCISAVQYLKRGPASMLSVYMRSSDVKALLPMDLLYLAKALRAVDDYYTQQTDRIPTEGPVTKEVIAVHIGSAHYYTSGGRE